MIALLTPETYTVAVACIFVAALLWSGDSNTPRYP